MSAETDDEGQKRVTEKTYLPVGLTPQQIVSAYNEDQWEAFINEWIDGLKNSYKVVQRFSGSGDKGRDVVGFVESADFNKTWDSYQCKHYDRPLSPSNIWIELGKLIYYTMNGDFSVPRAYRFVAPRDVGPKLKDLLTKPNELRQGLLDNWAKDCESGITETKKILLDDNLRKHIEAFDFRIIGYSPLLEIVKQHMQTPFWTTRFKVEVPKRPQSPEPPSDVAAHEIGYVTKLLGAYADAHQTKITQVTHITTIPKFLNHLKRSRQWFFQAEALNRFSRDHYPIGAFDDLKKQILDGVIDTHERDFPHGFDRVCATTDRAADLMLGNNELVPHTAVGDKKGICHHLANEDKLHWLKK
jgi:hypothetical protein